MAHILKVPTLQHIVLSRMGICLWKNESGFANMAASMIPNLWDNEERINEKIWSNFENKIRQKISRLHMPQTLSAPFLDFVKFVGMEFFDWLHYLDLLVDRTANIDRAYIAKYLDCTVWTAEGRIDIAKTAEVLLSDGQVSLSDKLRISCVFCVVDSIEEVWKQLPEMSRNYFARTYHRHCDHKYEIYHFWICFVTGKEFELKNTNVQSIEHMFCWGLQHGDEAAVKYFWRKLSTERRLRNCRSFQKPLSAVNRGIVLYFLSVLTFDQVFTYFSGQDSFFHILERLVSDYLCCHLFVEMIKRVRGLLSYFKVIDLLCQIAKHIYLFSSNDYRIIFRDFWWCVSSNLKIVLFRRGFKPYRMIKWLSQAEDLENIKLVLRDIGVEERKVILLGVVNLLVNGKAEFFKLMVGELISEEETEDFKRMCVQEVVVIVHKMDFYDDQQWRFIDSAFWCFAADEVLGVKKKLLCDSVYKLVKEILTGDAKRLQKTDRILRWFLPVDEDFGVFKKEKIAVNYCIVKAMFQWICEDEWMKMEIVLNWCFSSQDDINRYKKELASDTYFVVLLTNVMASSSELKLVDKVLDWCFVGNGSVEVGCERLYFVCANLLSKQEYKLADKFLSNYLPEDAVNKFKSDFVLSNYGLNLCNQLLPTGEHKKEGEVENLIGWFNPCSETMIKLNKNIEMSHLQNIFHQSS